jgi:hypothetical protein
MSKPAIPTFRDLSREESEAILTRNHVGRVAYADAARVHIEPIGYVYAEGVVNCRTSPGHKLEVLAHFPYVSFEVDEVEGPFSWRSVVATGTAYHADPEGSPHEREAHTRAVELFRRVIPETLTDTDPTPFRNVVLRIHIAHMTGREASPGGW